MLNKIWLINNMKKLLSILLSICIIWITYVSLFQFSLLENKSFYVTEFGREGIASSLELSTKDQARIADGLINYLSHGSDNLQLEVTMLGEVRDFYSERELLHMLDVQNILKTTFLSRLVSIIIAAILICILLIMYFKTSTPKLKVKLENTICNSMIQTTIASWVIIGILIGLISINFNKAFIYFHKLLFTNDLYLLNPRYDKLIVLLPEEFFIKCAVIIGVSMIGSNLVYIIISYIIKRSLRKRL